VSLLTRIANARLTLGRGGPKVIGDSVYCNVEWFRRHPHGDIGCVEEIQETLDNGNKA